MGTVIRPELSKKNKYYISKYRYYELKYFCLQYPEWKKELLECQEEIVATSSIILKRKEKRLEDRVSEIAIRKNSLERKINIIVSSIQETDPYLQNWLLKAVTEGISYVTLKVLLQIPCGKEMFYDRYHKFFWILSCKLHTSL